jgi:hypothetical protein
MRMGTSQSSHGLTKFSYGGAEILILDYDLRTATIAGQV